MTAVDPGPAADAVRESVLVRAEALYEAGRKRVSGRPPWSKLDPADPYDMGMRDEAIRQAEAGVSPDPVHDAEVAFLFELSQGRDAPLFGDDMALERLQDRARQRARKAGRAEWHRKVGWVITEAGSAWLAAVRPAGTGDAT